MSLPFDPPLEPMLARAAPEIPREGSWLYEPKWDGFRAVIFRDGDHVHIASRNALALERYFPELIQPLQEALPDRAIVDGEIVIATDHGLDFDALQQRIHPAASRVRMLAEKTPASVVLFDILAEDTDDLRQRSLEERRTRLLNAIKSSPIVGVTPQTTDVDEATTWFTRYEGAGTRRRRREEPRWYLRARRTTLDQDQAPPHRRLRRRRLPRRQRRQGHRVTPARSL